MCVEMASYCVVTGVLKSLTLTESKKSKHAYQFH